MPPDHYSITSVAFDDSGRQLVSADKPLPVTFGEGAIQADINAYIPPNSVVGGTTSTTTSGNPVALGATIAIRRVHLKAKENNLGDIYVGGSDTQAYTLLPGDRLPPIEINDLSKVFIDSQEDGDGVEWIYEADV
jgi:hypothetical protein